MAGGPKTGFWIAVGLVVLGLVAYALFKAGVLAPEGKDETVGEISPEDLKKIKGGGEPAAAEAPDNNAPTTVKEYEFVPSAKLPPVQARPATSP